jgi:hypothetical protein
MYHNSSVSVHQIRRENKPVSFKFVILLWILLGLSSAWSFTIKVQGKFEMGDHIASMVQDILNSTYDEVAKEQINSAWSDDLAQLLTALFGSGHQIKNKKREAISYLERDGQEDGQENAASANIKEEMSLLDDMVNNNEESAHVYGKHNKKERKRPRNDIIV